MTAHEMFQKLASMPLNGNVVFVTEEGREISIEDVRIGELGQIEFIPKLNTKSK